MKKEIYDFLTYFFLFFLNFKFSNFLKILISVKCGFTENGSLFY